MKKHMYFMNQSLYIGLELEVREKLLEQELQERENFDRSEKVYVKT